MKTHTCICLAALATTLAQAQPAKLQAGLWEQSMTMKSSSGEMESKMAQMQQRLASMPPDQRKMVEDMMARQGVGAGPGAGPAAGNGQTIRMCISAEQASRSEVPQQEGNCKQEMLERNGSTVRYRFSCNGNPPTSGEGEYTMSSPTSYSGHATVNTQVKGKPEKVEMTQSGKWLGADCGSLKPRVVTR